MRPMKPMRSRTPTVCAVIIVALCLAIWVILAFDPLSHVLEAESTGVGIRTRGVQRHTRRNPHRAGSESVDGHVPTRECLVSFIVKNRVTSELIKEATIYVGETRRSKGTSGRISLASELIASGFTVRANGYESKEIRPWGVEPEGTVFLNPLVRLNGRVVHQRRGLEGVAISYMALPPGERESTGRMKLHPHYGRCTSDNDGRFVLAMLPYGYSVSIEVQKHGYTTREPTLITNGPTSSVEIEMERGAILHLNVKGLARPIPLQIRLHGRGKSYDKDWSSAYVKYAIDGDGSIDMTISPGDYHLELLTEGCRFYEADLNINNEAFVDVKVDAESPRHQVKVVDSAHGEPIYHAYVRFGAYSYKTSVYGECSFPASNQEVKTIVVTKGGYFPFVSEISSSGVNTVVLEKAPRVPVRFVSEEGGALCYRGKGSTLPRSDDEPFDIEGDSGTWQSLPLGRIGIRLAFDEGSRSEFILNLASAKPVVVPLRRFKASTTPVYVLERWIDGSERLVGTVRSQPIRIPVRKNATYRTLNLGGASMGKHEPRGNHSSSGLIIGSYILPEVRLDPPVFVDRNRSPLGSFPFPSGWWRASYRGKRYLVNLGRDNHRIDFDWDEDDLRRHASKSHVDGDMMLLHRLESDRRLIRIDHIDLSSEMIPVAKMGDLVAVTGRGSVRIWRTAGFADADSFTRDFELTQERRIVFRSRDSRRARSVNVSLVIPGKEYFPPIVVLRRLISTGECLRFYTNEKTELVLSWVMDNECRSRRILPFRQRQDLNL